MMKMATLQGIVVAMVIFSATVSLGVKRVQAQTRHVVGGDRGWDPSSDIFSWSSDRIFRVGDEIWFTYSAAHGLVAELRSKEEYESCDLRNPIEMYTDGLHAIPLEREGIRYFVSTEPENCYSGLKLHVEVLPRTNDIANPSNTTVPKVEAEGPSAPSGSPHCGGNSVLMLIVLMLCVTMGLAY